MTAFLTFDNLILCAPCVESGEAQPEPAVTLADGAECDRCGKALD